MAEAQEFALPALTLGLASEPLLSPDPVKRVQEAVKAGIMDIRLGTNGRLLTEPLIEALIDSGLTRLEISLDAVEPITYRAIRGGDLTALEKRIHYFLDKRAKLGTVWPLLRVSFLRLPLNEGELKPFIKRWSKTADLIATQKPIWFPGSKLPKPPDKKIKTVPCGQPWQRLGVTHDGRIWPCCSWYGEKLLKVSATNLPIRKIWLAKELWSLRTSLLLNKPDPECLVCAKAGAF
jgi:MoaA/NifB/PqqE/SkfB family radical SAM enzyme